MIYLKFFFILLITLLGAWLAYMVFLIPTGNQDAQLLLQNHLHETGVSNPVTAVLINFRGYDTFLELVVLLLAAVSVWSLNMLPETLPSKPGVVLDKLAKLLLSMLFLVAFYLLWAGGHSPGGAFQAGSLLGASGVLATLAGYPLPWRLDQFFVRLLIVLGVFTFTVFGIATLLRADAFFTFPNRYAKDILFIIELAATFSIGATLTLFFVASTPKESLS